MQHCGVAPTLINTIPQVSARTVAELEEALDDPLRGQRHREHDQAREEAVEAVVRVRELQREGTVGVFRMHRDNFSTCARFLILSCFLQHMHNKRACLHEYVSSPEPGMSANCRGRSAQSLRTHTDRQRAPCVPPATREIYNKNSGNKRAQAVYLFSSSFPVAPGEPAARLSGKRVALEVRADLGAAQVGAVPVQPRRKRSEKRGGEGRDERHVADRCCAKEGEGSKQSGAAATRQMSTVKTPMMRVMMTSHRCQRMTGWVGGARKAEKVSAAQREKGWGDVSEDETGAAGRALGVRSYKWWVRAVGAEAGLNDDGCAQTTAREEEREVGACESSSQPAGAP